jgi:Tat protein secretion system quality control protein TatD with DNase activity
MMLVDSHTHFELLHDEESEDHTPAVIERAQQEGISYFLNVCVPLKSTPLSLHLLVFIQMMIVKKPVQSH